MNHHHPHHPPCHIERRDDDEPSPPWPEPSPLASAQHRRAWVASSKQQLTGLVEVNHGRR
jgi:hypothetical protein